MGAPSIDVSKLPQRALFDTGVLIRALGERPNDALSPLCEALWNAMLANRREILIAAPSISEMIRQQGKNPVPHREGVEVIAFDQRATIILGEKLRESVIVQKAKGLSVPLAYMKYDAIIVACAARHRATDVIALDGGLRALCPLVGLRGREPKDLIAKQGNLDL